MKYRVKSEPKLTLLGVLILVTSINSSSQTFHDGDTPGLCLLQHNSVLNTIPSVATARINGTFDAKPRSVSVGQLLCTVINTESNEEETQELYVVFDILMEGDTPKRIFVEMAEVDIHPLKSSIILCPYSKIGKESRVNGSVPVYTPENENDGMYICNTSSVRIVFTGMPWLGVAEDLSHEVSKRSLDGETASLVDKTGMPDDLRVARDLDHATSKRDVESASLVEKKTKCYNSTFFSKTTPQNLGEPCNVNNGNGIGYRYMINEFGDLDCLTCCPDHYYDESSKGCNKCRDGHTQTKMNVWSHCKLRESGNLPTKAPTLPGISMQTVVNDETTTTPIPKTTTPERLPQPTGLKVYKIGEDYAIIRWNEVVSASNEQVKYRVEYQEIGSIKSHRDEVSRPAISLLDLSAGSCYDVLVEAVSLSGYGPKSNIIEVRTLRALPKPNNVHKSNVTGGYTWDADPKDHGLTIKAEIMEFGAEHAAVWTFTKQYSSGSIEIPVKHMCSGNFSVQLFYATDDQNGPKSETKVLVLPTGLSGWCIAFIILVCCIIILIAACFFKDRILNWLTHRYSQGRPPRR